jgi:hypothetical protein
VLRLRWNVPQAWSAWHGGAAAVLPARLPAPVDCLIFRREQRVHFRTLAADEAAALAALRRGRRFGAICSALARAGDADGAAARAAQLLATWLDESVLRWAENAPHGAAVAPAG